MCQGLVVSKIRRAHLRVAAQLSAILVENKQYYIERVRKIKVAIYHANTKTISRSNGHSATAKSAYICAEKVTDLRTGEVFDYSRKKGVMDSGIVMPNGINLQISSEELWNKAEAAERRKDSRVGREWEISLPHELSDEQRVILAKELTQKIADRYGVACEYAIHIPSREGSDERNYHVHILSTTRKIDNEGKLGNKSDIELENKALLKAGKKVSQEQIREVREDIANTINKHLERAHVNERISHKTLEEQGITREPTTHKGKAQVEVERRLNVELVKVEVQVTHDGAELARLHAEIEELTKLKDRELKEQLAQRSQPTEKEKPEVNNDVIASNLEGDLALDSVVQANANYNPKREETSTLTLDEMRDIALLREDLAENNCIRIGSRDAEQHQANDDKKYNYELFNIAREHKEFFTKQTNGDYSYYVNRDASVEVHHNRININRTSQENIRLALDVAVSKFGNEFEVQGSKSFIADTIKEIANNEKYANVSLANKEHQKLLDSQRHELQRSNLNVKVAVNPLAQESQPDLMDRVREHLAKHNEPTFPTSEVKVQQKVEVQDLEQAKEFQELSPIERAKQHLASLKEQPKSAKELAQEFEQKAQVEQLKQEQLKQEQSRQKLEKSRSQGRGFSM